MAMRDKQDQGKLDPFEDSELHADSEAIRLSPWGSDYLLLKADPWELDLWDRLLRKMPVNILTLGVHEVLRYGEQKYVRYGWRYVPGGLLRYRAACFRHLLPEKYYPASPLEDPETGLSHLSHGAGCAVIAKDLLQRQPLLSWAKA